MDRNTRKRLYKGPIPMTKVLGQTSGLDKKEAKPSCNNKALHKQITYFSLYFLVAPFLTFPMCLATLVLVSGAVSSLA